MLDGARRQPCFETARNVLAGEIITVSDVRKVACGSDKNAAPLRFDAGFQIFCAIVDLPAATFLGAITPAPAGSVNAGTKLYFVMGAGPVRIQRTVTALQPAKPGERLYVRGADGRSFVTIFRPGSAGSGEE
ncbi:hypothetical protein [Novosphingobium beihaiensis]|uniref:Uncharacterized protein n=1 Tax=Novosphingobium beihaiensis TaxID=2930389 RepID=A0ABT0BPL9_9SPHN|nr:hypothetical protein [Novosphingobium beihaiensis]MCJ2186997.1 hypothetical protein [Novosphingobium beihaiensis]